MLEADEQPPGGLESWASSPSSVEDMEVVGTAEELKVLGSLEGVSVEFTLTGVSDEIRDLITGDSLRGVSMSGPGPAPDPPAADSAGLDSSLVEAAKAFAETLAEQRYVEFLAQHSVKTCVERDCGVCGELAQIKADTIGTVRDKLVDLMYDQVVEVAALSARRDTPDDVARRLKVRLATLRSTPVNDLW